MEERGNIFPSRGRCLHVPSHTTVLYLFARRGGRISSVLIIVESKARNDVHAYLCMHIGRAGDGDKSRFRKRFGWRLQLFVAA